MSQWTEFFLDAPASVVQLELIEISHPNFTQTYRLVRNHLQGVTVTTEEEEEEEFVYYPMRIVPSGSTDDLSQSIRVDFGDLGEILPVEFDAVRQADGFSIRPEVVYRVYRSDDLSAPIYGPWRFQIVDVSSNREGSSFEARAPELNVTKTGELYRLDRFPTLRGFV